MLQFLKGAWAGFKRLLQAWFVGFIFGLTAFAGVCALRYWTLWTVGVLALFLPLHWNDLKHAYRAGDRKKFYGRSGLLIVCSSVVVGVVALASEFIPNFDTLDLWLFGICVAGCVLTAPYWFLRRVEIPGGPMGAA